MTDKVPMPVSGNPESKGAPDGVSGVPEGGSGHDVQGRKGGGESDGGAYPNPHTGKKPEGGGFMGHGGQTEMAYYGGGQAGEGGDANAPNAVRGTASGAGDVDGSSGVPTPDPKDRNVSANGRTITVEETSGTAAAEATGKVGTDAPYEEAQKHPGSG
ncbi:hypothetical protein U1701_02280 [Sphingomonas sp. PB2P19]|uniref:hypothetical protein n=1 Tax=Sphingomonas rhamnosi TaxID=3096156 RepID=UPI002FCAE1CB